MGEAGLSPPGGRASPGAALVSVECDRRLPMAPPGRGNRPSSDCPHPVPGVSSLEAY